MKIKEMKDDYYIIDNQLYYYEDGEYIECDMKLSEKEWRNLYKTIGKYLYEKHKEKIKKGSE